MSRARRRGRRRDGRLGPEPTAWRPRHAAVGWARVSPASSNGRTEDFDSSYEGSNPSVGTTARESVRRARIELALRESSVVAGRDALEAGQLRLAGLGEEVDRALRHDRSRADRARAVAVASALHRIKQRRCSGLGLQDGTVVPDGPRRYFDVCMVLRSDDVISRGIDQDGHGFPWPVQ